MATPDLLPSISTPVCADPVQELAHKRLGHGQLDPAVNLPVALDDAELSSADRILKQSLDIAFSALVVVAIAPLLLAIAIAIRLDSRGPAFYISERVGRNGRRFPCFKFRTMVDDAERQQHRMLHLNERDGVLFKVANDPRVTRVGRFLRRYSLDELPQFFNVLRGEMSVVGPRPPVASEVREYHPSHMRRLAVLPGITGLWQTQGRHDPSFENYVSLDLAYIENWSVALDLKIVVQTIRVVLSGAGV
jgi:exopolysaccharide biosynthesis polyprenyl glycosylphosphotransferase